MKTRLLLSGLVVLSLVAGATDRVYTTQRTNNRIRIDGRLDEADWRNASVAGDFIQNEPVQDAPVTQRTEVRLIYDNTSLYIGAVMFDTHPDSILHQLGKRDVVMDLNADGFRIGLDTYNKRQEGYVFDLSCSGVQGDMFNMDPSFDAVWESATQLTDSGWVAEIRIPYSAIRFPEEENQTWGLQFSRLIRRNREYDQWSPVRKDLRNPMIDWGTLTGLNDLHPPVRLSLTPYLAFTDQNEPIYNTNEELDHFENSYSYGGGADLKLGMNESFTLDVTLLPDFTQVQSDNKIKNLTAFEQIFDENRPFFKEGTSLFETGKLFYSRRIGRTPELFYSVSDSLQPGEELVRNPNTSRLINCAKVSGRTNGGLGIGIINAVTGNTYATARSAAGSERKILTEPLTNYSIFVLDQLLKNNSRVWFVNTNTMRDGSWRDANVYSGGFALENKVHSLRLTSRYAQSDIWEYTEVDSNDNKTRKTGRQFSMNLEKISGEWQYGSVFEFGDRNFDKNDLGYIFINDYSTANLYGSYTKYNPFWTIFRYGTINGWIDRSGRWSRNNELTSFGFGGNTFLLFNNNWSFSTNYFNMAVEGRDWFEPRVDGRYYRTPSNSGLSFDCSTNYNRPLAFNYGYYVNWSKDISMHEQGAFLEPRIRFNDHLFMRWKCDVIFIRNGQGFATFDQNGEPVFGQRDIQTVINRITASYQFNPNLSLSVIGRHYWSQGTYKQYYNLEDDGSLSDYPQPYSFNADFNTNYFNADVVFNWIFSPGSSFIVTYKAQLYQDGSNTQRPFIENLTSSLREPQTETFSIKALYFLDYERVTHRRDRRNP